MKKRDCTSTIVCSACKQEKDISLFKKFGIKRPRFVSYCNPCRIECGKAWRLANREKVLQSAKRIRALFPARARATAKRYRQRNLELVHQRQKLWREQNPEKHSAKARRWQKNNPEKMRLKQQNYARANREKVNARTRRIHAGGTERLSDWYIRSLLNPDHVRGFVISQDLIEVKRAQIKLERLIKSTKQQNHEQ